MASSDTQTKEIEITPTMTMEEILGAYPSAKRALFQKFHIGGCQSCGYSLQDTLEEVLTKHNRAGQMTEAVEQIYESARVDEAMQINPAEFKRELEENGDQWKILDVRQPWEASIVKLPNSELLTQELAYEMMQKWPRDQKILMYCHTGIRSLEATSYFLGHGLTNVKSLKGGIDRWAVDVDPSLPRYGK